MRVSSIGEYIKEQRESAKISLRQLSAAAGVSNPYLSQIERGLRRPSAEILQQIAKGLRISAEALYVQAGILEDRPADSGVRAAVLAAPELTERQKQVLLEIYESFRREATADTPEDAEQAAVAAEVAAIQAAAAEVTAAQEAAEAARAQEASEGAWEQATGLADPGLADTGLADTGLTDTGLDEEDDDPLAAPEPLGHHDAAGPPAP
ncbi:MAG TPA: helix-turn-helix transcriptional regulator [Streptosporangiaceae bacterium]|nr:helix-turn-helix transcriptional regulator [Streptosporangiaceae bacterium]